ncbi:MAG TPA: M56 family metallopeptidase [Candidatus Acidoferrales bacterium]|nr:M56 family metallopeptidase [Candidatus Acidoferrales bacterium]
MISAPVVHPCSAFLAHLFASAARSLCLGCFAALAVGALRVKSVSGRLAVWKMVLYAALAMPLLGLILPPLSLELPSAVARLIPERATVANALRPSEDAPATGALASEAFPTVPFRARPEIPLPKSDADVHPMSTTRTSRSDALPADRFISGKAAPVVRESDASPAIAAKNPEASFPWIVLFAATYISITLLFLARLLLGIIFSRGLVRGARPIAESDVTSLLTIDEREDHPAIPLRLVESELISVPITLGILRPIILLPVGWREWGPAALRAVLAHERSHVVRRDALTQRLSLLHRAIFWFSPLSWWLHGRLADAAEEASDEAALLSGADRAQYAETLLGFFVALQQTPRRVHWQGVSMAKAGQAEKRVDRILAWEGDGSMHLNRSLSISLLLLGVAVVIFAAAARPSIAHTQDQLVNPISAPAAAKPAPIANPTADAPPDPGVAPIEKPPALTVPEPTPPSAPLAVPMPELLGPNAAALPAIAAQWKNAMSDDQIRKIYRDAYGAISRAELSKNEVQEAVELQLQQFQRDGVFRAGWPGFDGGFGGRYVIVSGDSPILMSGDSEDVEHATSLRNKIKGDYIWFQHDEKNYVIRDQATVQRAKDLFKAEEELGKKQEALGKQQEALGDQQRELGKKMEAVHVQIPDMSADMQKLEAQMKQLSAGGTQQQLGDLQRQIAELQHKIGESQYQAGDQQRQIGEQMRELGRQQGELGQQQGQLGRQQAEASRQANEQMRQLLDDAITRSTAQPE